MIAFLCQISLKRELELLFGKERWAEGDHQPVSLSGAAEAVVIRRLRAIGRCEVARQQPRVRPPQPVLGPEARRTARDNVPRGEGRDGETSVGGAAVTHSVSIVHFTSCLA